MAKWPWTAMALAAVAAWGQKVDVEFDDSVDFIRYKSYAIRNGRINSKAPALNNELVEKRIQNEIRKRLGARGLAEDTASPQLIVRYLLGSADKREVDTYPAGWRGRRRVVVPYTQGTLTIDLRDPASRSLVWRAIVTERENNPARIEKRLDAMVEKAFAKYPPKTRR